MNYFNPCNSTIKQNKQIESECKTQCKPNCIQNNFDVFVSFSVISSRNPINSSRIYVFPNEKPFIKYIYTPKMDIHQLVYDLGGIIGLWFGLSAYSILYLHYTL